MVSICNCVYPDVVCKAVKKDSASGQVNGLTTKIWVQIKCRPTSEISKFASTTLLRRQFFHGVEIFSTRTIE